MSKVLKKCPNDDCIGDINIKYKSNLDNLEAEILHVQQTYTKPTILTCKECGILFSELVYKFNENEVEKNYEEISDTKYISQIEYKRTYFKNFCKKIANELNKDLDILEIGSYYGVLGSVIKDKVANYNGLELSKHGSDYAKKNIDLNIFNETIEKHLERGIKYDLVIMADVIEHFHNPFKVFNQINKILKKKRKIILNKFNFDSFYSKITGYNYHWILPFHLIYFSNKTLKNLGEKNNMSLYKIENDPRYTSVEYLLEKLSLIFPKLSFIFKSINKIRLLRNFSIKVNLRDLNIYYFIKND